MHAPRLLLLGLTVCAALTGCPHPGPEGAPPKMVAKHYAIEGYDAAREATMAAEEELRQQKISDAQEQLRRAIRIARYTLNRIDQDRQYGAFVAGQRFQSRRDGVLTDAELCQRLGALRAEAEQQLTATGVVVH